MVLGCLRVRSLLPPRRPLIGRTVSSQNVVAEDIPYCIVGGGPSGLLLSNLLSQYGVPSLLLEQQSIEARFEHPQAHFLNTRSMEILDFWLPQVSFRIRMAMPPVEQWKSFRFAADMTSNQPLAHVVHPVDRPLQANRDANGVLLEDFDDNHCTQDLSASTVGHLAQHTFCRILYEAAMTHPNQLATLRHETTVQSATHHPHTRQTHVHLSDGSIIRCRLCIAADGAHSNLRQTRNIAMSGQRNLQHLINIHVTTPNDSRINHAMLYAIFSPNCVAMIVRHSPTDYVVQIPFFPPYQTLEDDFDNNQMHTKLEAIFGSPISIQSIRPWTMSAVVSDRYWDHGLVLVGDAAHVFPPAGGFGMNTGLQDVHNLAWRLARCYHWDAPLETTLREYESERRPIAQQNAALSVRNYRRLLEVTKSCYLNEQHPSLLVRLLDHLPLPMPAKQAMFRSAFQAALLPLSQLTSSPESVYAKHLRSNLRRVLKAGMGLPLLFPRFEIGFQYGSTATHSDGDWHSDTWPREASVEVGRLVPHVRVRVVANGHHYARLRFLDPNVMSTSNLPAQLARDDRPTWVLVLVGNVGGRSCSILNGVRQRAEQNAMPLEYIHIDAPSWETNGLFVEHILHDSDTFRFETGVFMVRPDSHIVSIADGWDGACLDKLMDDLIGTNEGR